MIPINEMSQTELGTFVQIHLRQRGIEVTLSQAVLVTRYNSIDLEEVSRWSKVEGKDKEYQEIRDLFI